MEKTVGNEELMEYMTDNPVIYVCSSKDFKLD